MTRPAFGRTPPPRGPPSSAGSAIDQVHELRAQPRELAVRHSLHRLRPRHRRVAGLELKLHAAEGPRPACQRTRPDVP